MALKELKLSLAAFVEDRPAFDKASRVRLPRHMSISADERGLVAHTDAINESERQAELFLNTPAGASDMALGDPPLDNKAWDSASGELKCLQRSEL